MLAMQWRYEMGYGEVGREDVTLFPCKARRTEVVN
jgi:hypothetical protein